MLCIIYRPNLITYGTIISNGVFYVIRYSTLSRGRKHYNTLHLVLTATFGPDPNESGLAAGLTPNLTKGKLVFSNARMTNKCDIVLVIFPSQ